MKNFDLTQILKDCPKGTKLYSPIFGEVTLVGIDNDKYCPIIVQHSTREEETFTEEGKFCGCSSAECMLFPSKENRDWSTFKTEPEQPQKFEPFQKVLVRNSDYNWRIGFFDFEGGPVERHYYYIIGRDYPFDQCLPYEGNEHLKDTTDRPSKK